MPVVPIVLVAAALHASWNALVKSVADRARLMAVMGGATAALAVPLLLLAPLPHAEVWPAIGASVLLHLTYNLLLTASYRDGDYNQVYPIARGTAPPVVAVCSVLLVGERLSGWQVAGLLVVSGGLVVLAAARRHGSPRSVALAVMTGLLIAAYTVLDGVGVRHAGTVAGYSGWLFVGQGLLTALALTAVGRRDPVRAAGGLTVSGLRTPAVARGVAAGALSLAAYMLVLWAQTRGALAVVAALRETSVVFAGLIGAFALGERLPSRRIGASVLVAAGAVVLALG
ncbi:MAG TPA: hypothetical protein VFN55_02330 [Solirubrobacteraceae bacterium]|nr:hypothetical protein [Solirubrobacteraceae bacterium]